MFYTEQVRALLYRVGAETGLRRKELASLKVSSFDVKTCMVRVNCSYAYLVRDMGKGHNKELGLVDQSTSVMESSSVQTLLGAEKWAEKTAVEVRRKSSEMLAFAAE